MTRRSRWLLPNGPRRERRTWQAHPPWLRPPHPQAGGNAATDPACWDANESHPISKGKVENDTVTFEVETPGGVMKFALKQKGDEPAGAGEREGQQDTVKLAVKRTE